MFWKRDNTSETDSPDLVGDPVARLALKDPGDGIKDSHPRFTPFARRPAPDIARAITAARSIA